MTSFTVFLFSHVTSVTFAHCPVHYFVTFSNSGLSLYCLILNDARYDTSMACPPTDRKTHILRYTYDKGAKRKVVNMSPRPVALYRQLANGPVQNSLL